MVEQDLDSESDDEVEVCVAEMINGKPHIYVCPALSSPNSNASRSSKTKNKNMAEIGKEGTLT